MTVELSESVEDYASIMENISSLISSDSEPFSPEISEKAYSSALLLVNNEEDKLILDETVLEVEDALANLDWADKVKNFQ